MDTTSRLGIEYPVGTDAVSSYPTVAAQAAGVLDKAVTITQGTLVSRPAANAVPASTMYYATDTALYYLSNGSAWATVPMLGSPYGPLTVRITTGSATAVAGQQIVANASGTITLPSSVATGSFVGVICSNGGASVTVSAPSGYIYGPGTGTSSTSLPLNSLGASVTLQFDGTNWATVAGRQDTGWETLTLASGWTWAGAGYGAPPAARLVGDRVYLRGAAQAGDPVTTTFVSSLPAQFNPETYGLNLPCASGGYQDASLAVGGNIVIDSPTGSWSSGNIVFIDGVSYSSD